MRSLAPPLNSALGLGGAHRFSQNFATLGYIAARSGACSGWIAVRRASSRTENA